MSTLTSIYLEFLCCATIYTKNIKLFPRSHLFMPALDLYSSETICLTICRCPVYSPTERRDASI